VCVRACVCVGGGGGVGGGTVGGAVGFFLSVSLNP
jgi:hypothetical protein